MARRVSGDKCPSVRAANDFTLAARNDFTNSGFEVALIPNHTEQRTTGLFVSKAGPTGPFRASVIRLLVISSGDDWLACWAPVAVWIVLRGILEAMPS